MFPAVSNIKPNHSNIAHTATGSDGWNPAGRASALPEPKYLPDVSVKLWQQQNATYIEANPAVQALLDLDSPMVRLGRKPRGIFSTTSSSQSTTATFDPNIPERDRPYARMSNEGMLRLYMDRVITYDSKQQDWSQPLPYDRLKTQFLTVLSYYPERQHDIKVLRFATSQMENYLTAYREILADAVSRRPDLVGPLEHVGIEAMELAVMLALEEKPIYGVLLTADQMLDKANAWAAAQTLERQLKESSDFYSKDDCVAGINGIPGGRDAYRLSRGDIFYADLQTLLRHAPMGVVRFHRLMGSSFMSGGIRVVLPPKMETRVTYGPGTVQQLHYWKDLSHNQFKTVIVGADGYWEDDGPMESFTENIPHEVRTANLKHLEKIVITSRNQQG